MKDRTIILQGTKQEVIAILQGLIERYGKDARITDILKDHNREELNLQ